MWSPLCGLWSQDFTSDWSPEESSRRLQQGKVTICVTAGHLQQQPHSPPHLFSGRASGEVSIPTGQTVAPGLSHQHQRWKRHHSGSFSYDLTDNLKLFLMSHEAESLVFSPHQVLIHLKRTLSRGECRGQSRSRNWWPMFTLCISLLRGSVPGAGVQADGSETLHPVSKWDRRSEGPAAAAGVCVGTTWTHGACLPFLISPFFFCSSSELWDAQRRQRYVAIGNPEFRVRV